MAGDSLPQGQTFSTTVGLLYIFNLIVGTGALALPRAFQTAGYVLSVILLFVSAFTSYVCATFVLESLAIANCLLRRQRKFASADLANEDESVGASTSQGTEQEESDFAMTKRVELSEMAHMFLGRVGTLFAYFVLVIYLFGDLAVYSTTVPKSLMNVICSSLNASTQPANYSSSCHSGDGELLHSISRFAIYQFCVAIFIIFCLPMVLMGMTKTKWLQLATTLSRWTAFILMIVKASVQLLQNGSKRSPAAADLHGFGSLFGVAVYAFMCHHSIPGLVTPIRDKAHLSTKLVSVYSLIYLFYCALSMTGSFAFEHVQDIYTINFLHDDQKGGFLNALLDYFLALFPVFVLTSSYIIVAITLCNNIRALFTLVQGNPMAETEDTQRLIGSRTEESEALLGEQSTTAAEDVPINFHSPAASQSAASLSALQTPSTLFRKFGVPVLVVLLPAMLSLMTDNVLLLASITGSFPGVGVQYVLPALLVLGARRALSFRVGCTAFLPSHLRSPFAHWLWPMAILCWSLFAVVVVSVNIFHLCG